MPRMALRQASFLGVLCAVALVSPAAAQGRGRLKQRPAAAGIPGQPDVYYAGPGGGGVWKTTDGGNSWEAVFKDQPTASIGAIALAPSNPNLVWVGTGEGNPRNDVIDGRGVFLSPDAGKSWRFMGLSDAGQISRIVIDPANPDVSRPSCVPALSGATRCPR